MNSLQIPEFNNLIQQISIDSRYLEAIEDAQTIYLVKPFGLHTLSPTQVVQLINRNFDKSFVVKSHGQVQIDCINETFWALNEFKLFVWVSVCYGYTKNKEFQNFNQQDYAFLYSLFTRKSSNFLEYNLKCLTKQLKKGNEKWSFDEQDLLIRIIRDEDYSFKWSDISFRLFNQSNKTFFRTQQKCREKWFNHLDPEVNRRKWTLEEDLSLFNNVLTYGTRWALISKIFNGTRTDHMIKNRFNSLRKKYQSKFNRTSSNKIDQKIYADLYAKVHGVEFQSKQVIIQKVNKKQEISEIKGQTQVVSAITQVSLPRIYFFNQFDQESFIEWQQKPMQLRQLSQFDIEKMLFTQSTLNIQPFQRTEDVELIEVEMFAFQQMNDQYISLLD